jgi:hypothetical protein
MSRIAAEELPQPTSGAPVWGPAPLVPQYIATASPARSTRRHGLGLAVAGGLVALAVGTLVYRGLNKDDSTAASGNRKTTGTGTGTGTGNTTVTEATASGQGAAGNSTLTAAELDAAYS